MTFENSELKYLAIENYIISKNYISKINIKLFNIQNVYN